MLHPDQENEQNRLNKIIEYITGLIKKKFSEKDYLVEQQSEINHTMWEDAGSIRDLESISDFMQHINLLKQNLAWSKKTSQEIVRLDKQLLNPYFARIDFKAAEEEPDRIYIGIHTLFHDDSGEVLIYDWRAPISSMFYDFEPGQASYICPAGVIRGEITLKRQFRISGGKIDLMFDSSLVIQDNILQELLAENVSGRMKTIVATIQKEQNAAIRHEGTKVLAIQGMAGSGKTSVAMHRASYLLYKHKKTITADNLVILSTTDVLSEYISDVLPELGEEEIRGVTYSSLFSKYTKLLLTVETQPKMLESLLTIFPGAREHRLKIISLKSSKEYIDAIHKLFEYYLSHLIRFETITYNNQVIASEKELDELFFKDFSKMPVAQRFKRIESRVSEKLKIIKRAKASVKAEELENEDAHISHREAQALSKLSINQDTFNVYEKITKMLSVSPVDLYSEMFSSDDAFMHCLGDLMSNMGSDFANVLKEETQADLKAGRAAYEDLAPLMALSLLLGSVEPDQSVKHLIIDEAQDYSSVQLFTLSRLFPAAGITLLGDVNQNISLHTSSLTLEEQAKLIAPDSHTFLTLDKSYRSTYEITRFSSQFLSVASGEPFGRYGQLPTLVFSDNSEQSLTVLLKSIHLEVNEGLKTIAIITRTQKQADDMYNTLEKRLTSLASPFRLMNENFEYMFEGVMVVPSYLSKGLEFDSVHVVFENQDDYSSSSERGLLYTIFSRALHRLTLYSPSSSLPEVLSGIDPTLYKT
jgi:DNA helicase-2/ATP-dependent DNA helicase PcrA